jgi:hypothetical protein
MNEVSPMTQPKTPRWEALVIVLVGAAAGCNGQVMGGAGAVPSGQSGAAGSGVAAGAAGTGGSATGAAGTGAAGTTPSLPAMCAASTTPRPGRSPLRRLNLAEYKRTVKDLLGVDTAAANTFPPDNTGLGFTNNADVLSVTSLLAESYMTAAETFAAAAVAKIAAAPTTLLPCDPAKPSDRSGEDACAKQFIGDFGLRAFRRPLTADETTTFTGLYTTGRTGGVFADGIALVIEAMLQSADFLYRVEASDPAAAADATAPVGPYEMATRLSYFLWGTMPDKALLDAAAAGKLGAPADLEPQARRMLADARARSSVASFHGEWLNTAQVLGIDKDKTMFPQLTDSVRAALYNEVSTFVDQVFWTDGKVETLLSAPYSYVNKELAGFYGITPPAADGFQKVMLDAKQRAGIITQGAILAANAKANQTSPVLRGKFVREQLFCRQLPPPPANLVIVAPEVTPGSTTRQRFAQHEKDAGCAACHQLMDGIGLGFEAYDPVGRWRTSDQGLPIDASGSIVNTADANGPFNGGVELATKLAGSAEVRGCVVRQWFRYANGRSEIPDDACTLGTLNQQFDSEGHDMRELLVNIVMSDAFRYRVVRGGGVQ